MEQLLRGSERPDAIFSASALGALGAMQVLKENNIAIPDEVAIVAFTNEQFTLYTEPALTAVDQHSIPMGNAAAEIFLEEISKTQQKFIPQKIVLKPELVIRASSLKRK